jgi:methyl-accepting chemotaxis protein
MKEGSGFQVFREGTSMRSKLWLGFFSVVAIIVAANLAMGYYAQNAAVGRAWGAVIGIIMGGVLGWVISKNIMGTIGDLASATRVIGEGDLSKEVPGSTTDEIGQLARSFNQMVFSLREMIFQFRSSSSDIIEATDALSASVQGLSADAEEVAVISNQISRGAHRQSQLVENTFAIMKRMADSIQLVAEKSRVAAEAARRAGETTKRERESLDRTREELERVFSRVEDTGRLIRAFGDRIQKVTKMADIITGVAEQTNLLAFNAAIEATRAGEYGKGFSVVADEVRRLAEKSRGYSEEITTIIDEVQSDSQRVSISLDEQIQGVSYGRKAVGAAVGEMVDIMEKIIDMVEDIQEISTITQQQKQDAQQVLDDMGNVSRLAEEHLAATEETAKVARAQVEPMNKMVVSTQDLSVISERLQRAASRFTLSD